MKTDQISLTICENLPDFSLSKGLAPYLWKSPAPKLGLFNLKSAKLQSIKSTVYCLNCKTVYLPQCLGQIHITKQKVTTQQCLVMSSNSSADFTQGSPWKVSHVHFKFCLFSPMVTAQPKQQIHCRPKCVCTVLGVFTEGQFCIIVQYNVVTTERKN
jgi:hypothetical protein